MDSTVHKKYYSISRDAAIYNIVTLINLIYKLDLVSRDGVEWRYISNYKLLEFVKERAGKE